MNVILLNKVLDYFREEPRRLDMEEWVNGKVSEYKPPCGTTACVTGATCIVSRVAVKSSMIEGNYYLPDPQDDWPQCAAKKLELTYLQADRLFRRVKTVRSTASWMQTPQEKDRRWPVKFATAYIKATTPAARFTVLEQRIEHFIATDGRE